MKYVATTVYILSILIANQTAAWFVPLPIFGMVSVGTFFFALTFTQRDVLHAHGRSYVYAVIAVTAVLSAIQSLIFATPPRIIVASLLALVLSEAADTEVFHTMKQRSWFVRALSSNAVSVPLDTLIAVLIMFAGVLSWSEITELVIGVVLLKYLIAGGIAYAYTVLRSARAQAVAG